MIGLYYITYSNYDTMSVLLHQICAAAAGSAAVKCNKHNKGTLTAIKCFSVIEKNSFFKLDRDFS